MDVDGLPPLASEEHVCQTCALAYPDITISSAVETIKRLPAAVRDEVAALHEGVHHLADIRRIGNPKSQ